ncbi:MAG: mechanosensitive ion channel domain-containing protein [Pseudomonadota bacterium]
MDELSIPGLSALLQPILKGSVTADIIVPFLILILFVVMFKWFASLLQRLINRLMIKVGAHVDAETAALLVRPLRLLVLTTGMFIAIKTSEVPAVSSDIVGRIIQTVISFFAFQIVYYLLTPIGEVMHKWDGMIRRDFVTLGIKVLRIAVVFAGGVSILELWGIAVAPILGGLGLLGVAVALGSQDLFKNMIGGFLIVTENRFSLDDVIDAPGLVMGTVERIGLRSCLIRQFDDCPIHVPNASLADTAVVNYTRRRHRRIYWMIGLEYGSTVEQLKQVRTSIEQLILGDPQFVDPAEMPVFVRIDQFGPSSIDIMVYCFVAGNNWQTWLDAKEWLALHIKHIVEEHGCSFAFPSQSIYIEKTGDPVGPTSRP